MSRTTGPASTEPTARRGVGEQQWARRGVLTAAWTAPVVVAAAAAPAMAASPGVVALAFNNYSTYNGGSATSGAPNAIAGNLSVRNTGAPTQRTLATVTVRLSFDATQVAAAPTATTGQSWSFTSTSRNGARQEYVFTWTGSLNANDSTSTLGFTIPLVSATRGQTIGSTATATSPGATAAVATSTFSS